MKTNNEINKEILETLTKIREDSPELLKFADEMNVTIPTEENPVINEIALLEYNNSLLAMAAGYIRYPSKHILIIGAGFAGLTLARKLNNNTNYTITLIDKNNFHQFQPLLYQVALANLDASNISFPLRNIFKKSKNVRIRVTTVTHINTHSKEVETLNGTINYDYLVIATGAQTNYFGNTLLEEHVFSMKSTFEALQIRNTLLQLFENAVSATNTQAKIVLSVVIVGGGPTGVELSGALAEMKNDTLPFEYPELNFSEMKIYLIEGSANLLSAMSSASSKKSKEYLEEMGVTVMLNSIVKGYDGSQVILQDESSIDSAFVIWAAGVKGNLPNGINPDFIVKSNQIKTDYYHRVIASENVFALGDIAYMESEVNPKGLPQLASVAIDQSVNLANNFLLLADNKPIRPFKYINKGSMATVGRNKAVVDLAKPRLSFQGFFAWLIWMTLHLFLLISFKNRLIVFINWLYKYFTHRQSLALLFPKLVRNTRDEV
jgi:NADH dehydrogenase